MRSFIIESGAEEVVEKIDEASGKLVLSIYINELNFEKGRKTALESKSSSQLRLISLILGLYGTMTTIFFVSTNSLIASVNIILIQAYTIFAIVATVSLLVALLFVMVAQWIKEWLRPLDYYPTSQDTETIKGQGDQYSKSLTEAKALIYQEEKVIIDKLLDKIVSSLGDYCEKNNQKVTCIKWGFRCTYTGLFCVLASLAILILIGGQLWGFF